MNLLIDSIGGYPALELSKKNKAFHVGLLQYQSARAAFTSLLQNMQEIQRIWMPTYICESMLRPIKMTGKKFKFYHINEEFDIETKIELEKNDLLLYVNYFGICEKSVSRVLKKFNRQQVIIDCSQAFYTEPYDCLATIYSPRKFFGVPDGGLMQTSMKIKSPLEQDNDSILRMEHLITRLAFSAEAGYASYQRAEASLEDCSPKAMSQLTKKLLNAINYLDVKNTRVNNFYLLHEELGKENQIKLGMKHKSPLCYPFLTKNKVDKKILYEKKIFIPTYWPDVEVRGELSNFERDLVDKLIPIPCHQALNPELDIYFILQNIKGVFS